MTDEIDPPVFVLKSNDANVKVFVTFDADPTKAFVSFMDPDRDAFITVSKVVWDMIAASVANQF